MKNYLKLFVMVVCFISCNQDKTENNSTAKIQFFDNETILSDTAKEVAFVDSLTNFIARNKTKSTPQETSKALPLNRAMYVKFLKYMNTACQSEGKLLFVFVDKVSGKIIDLNGHEKNKVIYLFLTKEEFLEKLKIEEIDFKLIQKNTLLSYCTLPTPLKTRSSENASLPDDDIYTKVFFSTSGSESVLFGASYLCTELLWFKKQAAPGFILKNPFPGVEESKTFLSSVYLGEFYESVSGFDYNQTTKRIEGCSVGYVEVKVAYAGLVVGTKYRIKATMTVTTDNRVTYNTESSLF